LNRDVEYGNVKASNFGPHGNFGLFFQVFLLSKRVLQKNDWNKSCGHTFDLQSRFCSFLAQNLPKEATRLARNVPNFRLGSKLEASKARIVAFSRSSSRNLAGPY
jgi:hypothetical protein